MTTEFEKIIQTEEIFFKYAKGMRDVVGRELHTYSEILFFISGDVEFISEKGRETLSPHTVVIIPKETFHQFIVLGDNSDYIRCVFNFETVSQLDALISSKINKIMLIQNDKITDLFKTLTMIESMNLSEIETNVLLKSLFAEILVAIKRKDLVSLNQTSFINPKVEEVLSFINKNIQKRLTVPDIAAVLNISDSHLAHIFKHDMNISVHKYILKKDFFLHTKKSEIQLRQNKQLLKADSMTIPAFMFSSKKCLGFLRQKSP